MLDLEGVTEQQYNAAIAEANRIYKRRMHNICCDNCHSHVAQALNILKYKGYDNHTMITVWWMVLTRGRYVHCKHFFFTYIGWILIGLIALFSWLIPYLNRN